MARAWTSGSLIKVAASVCASMSEYNVRKWRNRLSLTSQIALRRQLVSALKLRTRFGPQYPHPITPTLMGDDMFGRLSLYRRGGLSTRTGQGLHRVDKLADDRGQSSQDERYSQRKRNVT